MDNSNLVLFENNYLEKHEMNQNVSETQIEKADNASNIIKLANPLLIILTKIKETQVMPDVDAIQAQILLEIKRYISALESLSYNPEQIDCAVYVLCAALDEAILSHDWGTQSDWVQNSLLSQFRSETLGGERFYVLIEKLMVKAKYNLEVLELMYILLCFDFQGIYHNQQLKKRDEVRRELHHLLLRNKSKYIKKLSDHVMDDGAYKTNKKRGSLLANIFFGSVALFIIIYAFYSYKIFENSNAVNTVLNSINHESPITVYSQLINRDLFHKQKVK